MYSRRMADDSAALTMRIRILSVLLWYGITLLPFDFVPLRFEGHETHRAGLTLLIAVGGIGVMLTGPRGMGTRRTVSEKAFIAALVVLALTWVLSAVFALSPMLGLTGDLVRRMGLLTQLGLIALVLMSRLVDWRWLARGFWFAGVIAAVYTLLQSAGWLPNPIDGRAFGPLGAPTFTAGWLVNALIWSGVWVASEHESPRWLHGLRIGGGMLMAAGLLATGGRGALVGLMAALVVGVLAYGWVMRRRAVRWGSAGLAVCGMIGAVAVSQIDWQTSPAASWPLISRLNPTLPDTPRAVREQVWGNALDIMRDPPLFMSSGGVPDRFHALRFWFGYGQDHFELVHRPWVDDALRLMEQGRPIDRAHNVLLDVWVMHGAVGVIAWLAVWGGAALLAVTRLYCARRSGQNDWPMMLVLMVITAHTADLLFSFETVAAGWGAWMALGLVLRREDTEVSAVLAEDVSASLIWVTRAGVGMLLARSILQLPGADGSLFALLPALMALIAVTGVAGAAAVRGDRFWRWMVSGVGAAAVGMIAGGVLSQVRGAESAALVGFGGFGVMLGALGMAVVGRFPVRREWMTVILTAGAMLVAAVYVFSEARAQIRFQQGLEAETLLQQAELHRQAVLDFPLDSRLQMYAASGLYYAAVNRIDGVDVQLLTEARQYGEAAVKRNPYDTDALAVLDEIEGVLATLQR